jgi:hypothetical protein
MDRMGDRSPHDAPGASCHWFLCPPIPAARTRSAIDGRDPEPWDRDQTSRNSTHAVKGASGDGGFAIGMRVDARTYRFTTPSRSLDRGLTLRLVGGS